MPSKHVRFARPRLAIASLLGFGLAAACGGGETGGDDGDAGSAGAGNVAGVSSGSSGAGAGGAGVGIGGNGGVGGATRGGNGGSAGTTGAAGTNESGAGGTAGSVSAAGGTNGSGASSGTSGAPADAGPLPGVPEPTDSGLSVYSTECRGETVHCESAAVHCLGIFLNEGGVGYTCSNLCRTTDDCSDAPSGAEAQAGCVTFTSASRCVLVCYDNGEEYSCPTGMGCYRYPDFPVGYCLWL